MSGTRTRQNTHASSSPPSRHYDRAHDQDLGMTKFVTASFTMTGGQITAASGLGVFAVNEMVVLEGTNLNNGFFTLTAVTGTALTTSPPCTNEGPIAATLRCV